MSNTRATILISSGDGNLQNSLQEILETRGYRVIRAPDYQMAGEIVMTSPVDLVLLGTDEGFEEALNFIGFVRNIKVRIGIIVIGKDVTREQMYAGYRNGVFDFISLPLFDTDRLLKSIEHGLHTVIVPLNSRGGKSGSQTPEDYRERLETQITVITRFCSYLSTDFHENAILERFVGTIKEFLDCSALSLLLIREDSGELQIRYTDAAGSISLAHESLPYPSNPFVLSMTHAQSFYVSRHPFLSTVSSCEWSDGDRCNSEDHTEPDCIIIPLKPRGNPMGFVLLSGFSEHLSSFTGNLSTVEILASQFAIAYEVLHFEELANRRYLYNLDTSLKFLEHGNTALRSHSERVTQFCLEIADELNLDNKKKQHLREAALLHDIGKLYGNVSGNAHIVAGTKLISSMGVDERVRQIITQHHEHFDGSGSPAGLKGDQIILEARILGIANDYDLKLQSGHMKTSPRSNSIISELETHAGKKYDPDILKVFIGILRNKQFTRYEKSGLLRFRCNTCGNEIIARAGMIEDSSVNQCEICGHSFEIFQSKSTDPGSTMDSSGAVTVSEMNISEESAIKILVVDDHPHLRKAVTEYLTKHGFDVLAAAGGTESLSITRHVVPDIILLDLMMHPINGIDLCKIFRKNKLLVETPIIFLSASDDPVLLSKLSNYGLVDYIQKPFSLQELLDRIRVFLPESSQCANNKTLDITGVN